MAAVANRRGPLGSEGERERRAERLRRWPLDLIERLITKETFGPPNRGKTIGPFDFDRTVHNDRNVRTSERYNQIRPFVLIGRLATKKGAGEAWLGHARGAGRG